MAIQHIYLSVIHHWRRAESFRIIMIKIYVMSCVTSYEVIFHTADTEQGRWGDGVGAAAVAGAYPS